MDYDLFKLGNREFEHLSQSLARKVIGPALSQFGDGRDGGREATWKGEVPALGEGGRWVGTGVVQAKAKTRDSSVASNLTWLKNEITKEAKLWAAPDSKRGVVPDYFLLVTNVRLSAVPGSGVDAAMEHIRDAFASEGIPLRGTHIWHYDELRVLLDDSPEVRRVYRAWITPGDILSEIIDGASESQRELRRALYAHAARSLDEDNQLNLTQAGSARDSKFTVPEVFVDLPFTVQFPGPQFSRVGGGRRRKGATAELIDKADRALREPRSSTEQEESRGTVLVGGPGQGKSTITQYLAQVYRAEFLKDTDLARRNNDVSNAIAAISASTKRIKLDPPKARRWPIRIVMTKLADSLDSGVSSSLLEFLAQQVSDRSSVTVDVSSLRKWLETYPWLLVIDGLDEVPESSNRSQVLRAISDFYIDADMLGADVVVVTTTRPQGYGEEFDPKNYSHFILSPLELDAARDFAESFIRLRVGAGTDRCVELVKKFRSASNAESSSRLLGSPLQVTIFVVLIERQGQAPGDRWRLFSAYYRVILQREQEKPGPLAEMLRDFETEIDYLHRKVGHLLQRNSAGAGETSSTLELSEFVRLVERRLKKQGHSGPEARALSKKFISLATERLVFLTFQTSSTVGFEIRSLQEFMAAEWIGAKSERALIGEIRSIAGDPHWKNVVLFAMGCIFTKQERLKSDAVLLCEEMDSGPGGGVCLEGAELALDILLDGAAARQPRFEAALARQAVRFLDGPPTWRSRQFVPLVANSRKIQEVVAKVMRRPERLAKAGLINRLILVSQLGARDLGIAERFYDDVRSSSLYLLPEVLHVALNYSSPGIQDLADDLLAEANEVELLKSAARFDGSEALAMELGDSATSWSIRAYFAVCSLDISFHDARRSASAYDWVGMGWNPVNFDSSKWQGLASSLPSGVGWRVLPAYAEFMSTPNRVTLSVVLDALAESVSSWNAFADHRVALFIGAPWPLASLFQTASQFLVANQWNENDLSSWLRDMSKFSSAGLLGDYDTWTADERAWSSQEVFIDNFVGSGLVAGQGLESEVPIWADMSAAGISPAIINFFMSNFRSTDDYVAALSVLRKLDALSSELGSIGKNVMDDLIVFLCSQLGDQFHFVGSIGDSSVIDSGEARSDPTAASCRRELISMAKEMLLARVGLAVAVSRDAPFAYFHLGWLLLLEGGGVESDIDRDDLRSLGSIRSIVVHESSGFSSELLGLYEGGSDGGILWLAFWFDPSGFVGKLRAGTLAANLSRTSLDAPMENLFRLIEAPKEDVLAGRLADGFVALWQDSQTPDGPGGGLYIAELFSCIAAGYSSEERALYFALLADALLDSAPFASGNYRERSRLARLNS